MRTKKFLFATTFAMMVACMMMNSSCTEYVDETAENGGSRQVADKATVKLRYTSPEGDDVSVSQSACLPDNSPTLSRVPNLLPTVRR